MRPSFLPVLGLSALALALPAAARADALLAAGHIIDVAEDGAGGVALTVDGQTVLQDGVIALDPQATEVAGQTVVTGTAGSGGNACNAQPFVLSWKDGKPRVDGPVDGCLWLEDRTVTDEGITYASRPTAAAPGERWDWTPAAGFTKGDEVTFIPDPAKGWDDLSGLAEAHPLDVWAYKPIRDQMLEMLGESETDSFLQAIGGLGSGGLKEPGYVGGACDKFDCQATYGVLILDQGTRQPYLAWTLFGSDLQTRPDGLEHWSPGAVKALKEWMESR